MTDDREVSGGRLYISGTGGHDMNNMNKALGRYRFGETGLVRIGLPIHLNLNFGTWPCCFVSLELVLVNWYARRYNYLDCLTFEPYH